MPARGDPYGPSEELNDRAQRNETAVALDA
jgi:hypothetical protein